MVVSKGNTNVRQNLFSNMFLEDSLFLGRLHLYLKRPVISALDLKGIVDPLNYMRHCLNAMDSSDLPLS